MQTQQRTEVEVLNLCYGTLNFYTYNKQKSYIHT